MPEILRHFNQYNTYMKFIHMVRKNVNSPTIQPRKNVTKRLF